MPTSLTSKKVEDEQTLADLSSAHRLLQAKCQLVQTIYIKRMKVFLFGHIINILLTELSRSVWENLDLGRVYRPHCVRSVLTTSVKILPYRPPARLIRGKYALPRFKLAMLVPRTRVKVLCVWVFVTLYPDFIVPLSVISIGVA